MSGKIKIVMMTLCLAFSHLSLAADYLTGLLLAKPLVMNIGDVPVKIRYEHGVITLAIPDGNTSNAPLDDRGQDGMFRPNIQGDCDTDTDDCTVVRRLHEIQRFLASRNIPVLTLTLAPFRRSTSNVTYYSDDSAGSTTSDGGHVSTHSDDRTSAKFFLNMSFIFNNRRCSIDLSYSVRRGDYPMSWLWGEHFFNAHYATQRDSTRYFDPLQEGVLADVVNALNVLQTEGLFRHLHRFPSGETVDYHPSLLDSATAQVGNGWLQPLGSVETIEAGNNGRSQRRSTVTSGYVRYSVTLPQRSNPMPWFPSIDVTLLPSLSQQLVQYSRGIYVAAITVLAVVAGIACQAQSSGNHGW